MLMSAQTEAQTKEINKIKLDPAYVFAESTMENADEARETVCLTLTNFMNEFLEESGESRKVAAAELGAIKYITGKRGNANYVFGYIPVATFASKAPAPTPAPVAQAPAKTAAPTAPVTTPAASAPANSSAAPASYANTDDDEDESFSPEAAAAGLMLLGMLFGSDDVLDAITWDGETVPLEYHPAESDDSRVADMISELLESSDSRKAAYLLNVYKSTGKLRGYGALSTCRDAAGAYWLIIDKDGSIIALLGPGADDNRHDYVSGTTGHLASYGGKYAVWFTPRNR